MHAGPENKTGVDVTAVKQWTSRGTGGQRALLHKKKRKEKPPCEREKEKGKGGDAALCSIRCLFLSKLEGLLSDCYVTGASNNKRKCQCTRL